MTDYIHDLCRKQFSIINPSKCIMYEYGPSIINTRILN